MRGAFSFLHASISVMNLGDVDGVHYIFILS